MTAPKIFTREFVLCFFAFLTFAIVFHILIPTLPIYLARLGSQEAEIGVLIGILGVASLAFRPVVGGALMKISEKKLMMIGVLLFLLTSVAYLVATPFWPFLLVRVFQGIGFAFFMTASVTLIANISPAAYRGQSLSYFLMAPNISLVLAPSLGMFLINRFSFTLLFIVCVGLSLGCLLITNQLERRQVVLPEGSSREGSSFLSWKAVPPSISGFLNQFLWGALTAFFPLYAIQRGVDNPGYFFTAMAIMLMSGRALGGRILDRYSRDKVILPCLLASMLSMGILAFSRNLPMFILAAVIWGTGNAFTLPSLMACTLDRADSSRGPAMATFTGGMDLGMTLGPVMMGIVIHVSSYPIMFLCLAFIGLMNLAYFYFFVRRREESFS